MSWLVLFDVDGTLLLTHDEVYVEANRLALTEVYGAAPDASDIPGDTATAHTRRALAAAGLSNDEIDAGLPRWCEAFSAHYVDLLARADTSHWQLAPGARETLAGIAASGAPDRKSARGGARTHAATRPRTVLPRGPGRLRLRARAARGAVRARARTRRRLAPRTGRSRSATLRSTSPAHMQPAAAVSP